MDEEKRMSKKIKRYRRNQAWAIEQAQAWSHAPDRAETWLRIAAEWGRLAFDVENR